MFRTATFFDRMTQDAAYQAAIDNALSFVLDHDRQDSTFACTSVRNVWGYNGDPSASNGPQLISVPAGVQAIEGGRWIDSASEGAVFGANAASNSTFDTDTVWTKGAGWSISGGNAVAAASSTALYQAISSVTKRQVRVSFDITEYTAGTVAPIGDAIGTPVSGVGSFSEIAVFCPVGTAIGIIGDAFTGKIDNLTVEVIQPKFLTTTTTGVSLHPYASEFNGSSLVRKYIEFPTYAVSTAYAAGVQVAIKTSAGNWVYMTSSGGTSDGTAVVVTDADIGSTVTDNDITWTIVGYATLHKGGVVLEDASTNKALQSADFAKAIWTKGGAAAVAQNLTGADGAANTGWTLSGLSGNRVDYLFQSIAGGAPATRHEPSLVMKQVSSSGVISIEHEVNIANGQWTVDLSELNTYWEVIDRNHPAVTVVTEFSTDATGFTGPIITYYSGTGPLSVGLFNINVELGTFSTSQIRTTTGSVTRAATTLSDSTSGVLTAASGAGRIVVTPRGSQTLKYAFSSEEDSSNYIGVLITSTQVRLVKVDSSAVTAQTLASYTHSPAVPFCIEFYYDNSGMGSRGYSVGSIPPSFTTSADTTAANTGATFAIGDLESQSVNFQGKYLSVELATNKEAFGW